MPKRLASWNPERDIWEGVQMDLFSGLSGVFSETWPASGMTRNGVAFELPTWVPPTDDTEYSWLPTPRATRGGSATETVAMLPTPAARDGAPRGSQSPEKRRAGGHQPSIADVAEHLLPTPTATYSGNTAENHLRKKPGRSSVTDLRILIEEVGL